MSCCKKLIILIMCAVLFMSYIAVAEENATQPIEVTAMLTGNTVTVDVTINSMEVKGIVYAVLMKGDTTIALALKNAAKNVSMSFPEGKTGDTVRVFWWESIGSMKPVCPAKTIKMPINNELTTVLNFEQPGTSASVGQVAVEDDFVYLFRHGMAYKLDVSDEENPVVVAQNNYSKSVSAKYATAVQINGDYIYVGNRIYAGGYPTEEEEAKLTAGALVVLKKSDLSVVSEKPLGKKVSGMVMNGNLLVVNLQMRGWAIYDVTNPPEPVKIDEIYFETGEIQNGEIFEVGEKVYYAAAGFGDGIRMYDITEFADYAGNPESFKKPPTIGDDNLLWYYHFYSHGIGGNHTYDLTVKYPYVYATIAAMKSEKENEDRIQGILTFDITNVEEMPKSHIISMIANEDKNGMTTSSDTHPSIICRVGEWLVVNNDSNGIACFDIGTNPEVPEYVGTYNPFEGSCVYRITADEEGRLFLTDGSGVSIEPRLYIVEGLNK